MKQDTHRGQALEYWRTGIDSLDDLLANSSNKRQKRGIAHLQNGGFFGVIFGRAGSGKSILGLQLCCRFVGDRHKNRYDGPQPSAIYLSQEAPDLIAAKLRDLQFFFPKAGSGGVRLRGTDSKGIGTFLSKAGIYVLQMPLDSDGQIKVLTNVLAAIKHAVDSPNPQVKRDRNKMIFLCVDNAETVNDDAMLKAFRPVSADKDFAQQADAQTRAGKNFYKLLRKQCVQEKLHAFFVFEEPVFDGGLDETRNVAMTAQAYAADIAIHLTQHSFPNGYRERRLEIVKAKNQFYRRGQHHFSIVGSDGGIRGGDRNLGVVIYESVATQLHKAGGHRGNRTKKPLLKVREKVAVRRKNAAIGLGIEALDQKVCDSLWDHAPGARAKEASGYLKEGSVSVLVADLDSTSTEMALHFAFQGDSNDGCLISFAHDAPALLSVCSRFEQLAEVDEKRLMCFPPEHISEGKLLQDIEKLLNKSIKRVAIDNIYALRAKFPLITDEEHFLASLFNLFRLKNVFSLVIEIVELGEGKNPIEKSFAAGLAENVFLLRHVEFQASARKVFTVMKLLESRTPDPIWELKEKREAGKRAGFKLIADDTFRFYKNLLQGEPKQVQITMSLHGDATNSPLSEFLKMQENALRQNYGQPLDIQLYHRSEYSRYDEMLTHADIHSTGDCHIISIDEVWLEELISKRKLAELRPRESPNWGDYVTTAHDLAWQRTKGRHFAVPDRNNCGVLTFSSDAMKKTLLGLQEASSKGGETTRLSRLIENLCYSLLQQGTKHTVTWNQLAAAQDRMATNSVVPLFTFCMDTVESYVSFLLELVFSGVRSKQTVAGMLLEQDGILKDNQSAARYWSKGLKLMCRLLTSEDLFTVSRGCFRPSEREKASVLSRQWYSTWGTLEHWNRSRFSTTDGTAQSLGDLAVKELPIQRGGAKATVSGAWYLGIVRGGSCIAAGEEVIECFTSRTEDYYKLQNRIGLPVLREYYQRPGASDHPLFPIPYAREFARIPYLLRRRRRDGSPKMERVLKLGTTPFYRTTIQGYRHISPELFRLMIETGREAVAATTQHIAWRSEKACELDARIDRCVTSFLQRCRNIQISQTKTLASMQVRRDHGL